MLGEAASPFDAIWQKIHRDDSPSTGFGGRRCQLRRSQPAATQAALAPTSLTTQGSRRASGAAQAVLEAQFFRALTSGS
jgi:hypothetical protein